MADLGAPDSFSGFLGSNEHAHYGIPSLFSTNRNVPVFILKKIDWLGFFFKTETEKNILSCLCTWGVAKVGLVVLFCRFGALSGFYGSRKIYFPLEIIFSCRLFFSLRFFPDCSGFMNANCVVVIVTCFLVLVSALLFCPF